MSANRFQRFREMLAARFRWFMLKVGGVERRLERLFGYMRGEVIKQLPSWRADFNESAAALTNRISRWAGRLRARQRVWRSAISGMDASPSKMHEMLFEERTPIGRLFESFIITMIIVSVFVVMLDSVDSIHRRYGWLLRTLEWIFTIIFTLEYLLRIYSSPRPIRYMTSFFGIIDLVTFLPTYIAVIFPGAYTFLMLRILRVLRIFRLLRLVGMVRAGGTITASLRASREKIAVFLLFVLLMVTVMGSVLYIVEAGQNSGFTSIPVSIYWAIVTLTTVGYGDIAPVTWFGQMIAACVMITGYAVIAVPTGIVSAEFIDRKRKRQVLQAECDRCGKDVHESEARFCARCGHRLGERAGTAAAF